ncbi:MAG: YecA family protein [bacterium]
MTSKIGRNDPCPCGSGKKYKKCCMASHESEIRTQEEINMQQEAKYIINCALQSDARLVQLESLLFFSTHTGDAWLLDTDDNLALCLMQDFEEQEYVINETLENFSIEWEASYHIKGNAFIVCKKSGQIRTIVGYPTKEILRLSCK